MSKKITGSIGRCSLVKVKTMFFQKLFSVSLNHFKSFSGEVKPAPSEYREHAVTFSKKARSIMTFSIKRLSTIVLDTEYCYAGCGITKKLRLI